MKAANAIIFKATNRRFNSAINIRVIWYLSKQNQYISKHNQIKYKQRKPIIRFLQKKLNKHKHCMIFEIKAALQLTTEIARLVLI